MRACGRASGGARRALAKHTDALRCIMKRRPLPSVLVEPAVCREAEAVLDEGESLSSFVSQCIRSGVVWRRAQDGLMLRARDAVERGIREGKGLTPEELLERMDDRIDAAVLRLSRSQR